MKSLSQDTLIYMALNLDLPELLSLCRTSSKINKILCNNEMFWMNKIMKDFPKISKKNYHEYGDSYKEIYKHLITPLKIQFDINISYISYEDNGEFDDEAEKNISILKNIEFDGTIPIKDVRMIIKNVMDDFFQGVWKFGYYDIKINDKEVCEDTKVIYNCFKNINYDTETVSVYLSSNEDIDEDDEDEYDVELENLFNDNIGDYLLDSQN